MSSIDSDNPPYDPDTLYDHPLVELTQSAMGSFATCPQQYVFRYLMKIVPQGVSVPLVTGTAVHDVFEFILDPKNEKMQGRNLILHVKNLVDSVFDKVIERSDLSWNLDSEKLEKGRAQALAIVGSWPIVYDYREWFKVLHTELNIRSKPGATIDSPMMDRAAGKIDGIVWDLGSKTIKILEHKTRYSIKNLDFVGGLPLDHQAIWYMMMWEEWLEGHKKEAKKAKLGKADGFFYNVIAKPLHRSGTFDELVDRMTTAMVEKPENYFSFTSVEIEQESVDRARNNFQKVIKRMDGLDPGNVEMNTKACNMYGGCPYRKLCCAGADAGQPKKVLSLPQIDMYRFQAEHEELSLGDEIDGSISDEGAF
jgi:hypothetical protein